MLCGVDWSPSLQSASVSNTKQAVYLLYIYVLTGSESLRAGYDARQAERRPLRMRRETPLAQRQLANAQAGDWGGLRVAPCPVNCHTSGPEEDTGCAGAVRSNRAGQMPQCQQVVQ